MSTSLKTMTVATLIVAAAFAGTLGTAQAHGKHRSGLFIGIGSSQPDCSFYYWKWQKTGKLKWKYAYYECISAY